MSLIVTSLHSVFHSPSLRKNCGEWRALPRDRNAAGRPVPVGAEGGRRIRSLLRISAPVGHVECGRRSPGEDGRRPTEGTCLRRPQAWRGTGDDPRTERIAQLGPTRTGSRARAAAGGGLFQQADLLLEADCGERQPGERRGVRREGGAPEPVRKEAGVDRVADHAEGTAVTRSVRSSVSTPMRHDSPMASGSGTCPLPPTRPAPGRRPGRGPIGARSRVGPHRSPGGAGQRQRGTCRGRARTTPSARGRWPRPTPADVAGRARLLLVDVLRRPTAILV